MIYITPDDLTADSYQRFIDESTGDIENTLDKTELRAVSFMCTYLEGRYDTDLIFGLPWLPPEPPEEEPEDAPEEEDEEEDTEDAPPLPVYVPSTPPIRDELLVDILCKIMLYRIFRRNAPRKVPTDVKEDYDWAIEQLYRINSGRITLELPTPTDVSGNPVSNTIWGNSSNRDFYI